VQKKKLALAYLHIVDHSFFSTWCHQARAFGFEIGGDIPRSWGIRKWKGLMNYVMLW